VTASLGALLLFGVVAAAAPAGPAAAPADEHGRDRFKNPRDLQAYIAAQEEPGREAWQKPDKVVDALDVRAGQTVCDIGAGPGYFSFRLARRVGPRGRVYAVDVDARILDALRERVEKREAKNITPVLGAAADPLLPEGACDLILIVDTYHHFPDHAAYLRRLVGLLRPAGRIANVDFHKRPTPVGPEMEHRVAREEFLRDAAGAGLAVVAEPTFLENQYFIILRRRRN